MWLALGALVLAGCGGGDDSPAGDGGPDAENLCPGQITFEAGVRDLASLANLASVQVADVDDAGAQASSAPNGRAVLCLDDDQGELLATRADLLSRRDTLAGGVAQGLRQSLIPYPYELISGEDLDSLYDGLSVTRSDTATQVIVAAVSLATGEPVLATVSLDVDHDGSFARSDAGLFSAGDEVGTGGAVVFANVPGSSVAIEVTPPSGACTGPGELALEPGGLAGAVFACD